MFSPSVYTAWLDTRAGEIFEKMTSNDAISNEETLLLILKGLNDQLLLLSETMDKRFEQITNNFKWGVISTIGFLSLLIAGMKYLP